jgi:hypothetical protein
MNEAKPPLPPDEIVETGEAGNGSDRLAQPQRPSPPLPPAELPPSPPPAPARQWAAADPLAKSPGLALFLSIFFPGLGHIYVGSYERAVMIISGIAVSIWAMVYSDGRLWPLAFAIAFAYFYAIFDAYRDAQIANLAEDEELPRTHRQGEGRLMFGVFLTVIASLVLADKLDLFDVRWLIEWWPAIVLLIGLYFIGSWVWERIGTGDRKDGSSYD